jgi:hypothetical protein
MSNKSPKSTPRRVPKNAPDDGATASLPVDSLSAVAAWFDARIPTWFTVPVLAAADRDEVVITGTLAEPVAARGLQHDERLPVLIAHIAAFREATRAERIELAAVAQIHLQRHVSWAVRCGEVEQTFTNISTPIMTRLRFDERQVLDTLVDASIARSRSDALAWCVRLVAQHEDDWLVELRKALTAVEAIRNSGPKA